MRSVEQNLVFHQYLSLLPANTLACPLKNYVSKKLTDFSLLKIFIMANICKWENLREIEQGIRSEKAL
jgi:hypothetical protein